ncbi:restriction endonuclease subunit S [Morganella morganii]|uniref:restriction endonuclease subunit S n=1 Tax=Morganella morganii TaxID=582 RepID=UPI003EB7EB78
MATNNLVLAHKLVGEIPQDWQYIDFCELYSKPIRDFGSFSSTKLITFLDDGIPFIKSEMIKEGAIDWTNTYYISEEVHKALNKSYVKSNTILFSKIGSALGKAVVYEGEYGECNSNAAVAKIMLDSEKADKYFYTYLLNNPIAKRQFVRLIISLLPRINLSDINSLIFPCPPLSEQRKIAKILSTWDKAISTTERLIDNSKQQKKALMQQLLTGKKRLLDDSGKPFEGEWSKVELGKLLDYKQPTPYLVKSTDYSDEYSTPVLTAGKTFILGYSNENFGIFEEELPAIIFDDFTTASKFVDFPFKAKSSAMKILVAKQGVSIKFVYEAMQVLNYPVGGHQRHWISIFANLVIGLPSPPEQQKIASVLSNADKEIELLEQQLADLKQEKKALMQQLLTGKRRVNLS